MTFLAYISRVSNTALSSYLNVLRAIAVRLMKDCPSEAVAMKRDLIIATRHILQSDLRTAFLSQIDTLLDEHVLTGNSVTGHENLRPLAFSMLADLIHHCRAELTLPQLSRVVHTYCANVHDPTLASAIQTMCSKLLLNLIDPIASKEPSEAVKILQRILLAFVSRMEAMAEVRDEWSKWSKAREPLPDLVDKVRTREKERAEWTKRQLEKGKGQAIETDGDDAMQVDDTAGKEGSGAMQVDGPEASTSTAGSRDAAKAPTTEGEAKAESKKKDENEEPAKLQLDDVDIERAKPIKKAVVMVDPGPDPIKDARFLFRNLLFGFKTLGLALNRMGGLGPDAEMMCRFFDAAVKCMVLFDPARDQGREQKEVMEVLTTTLVQTELVIFQEVIENRMGFFFDELIRNHELLVIPQSLLSNENVSQHCVAILFRFLSARLPDLGNSNKENTLVMLRLYKMSFMAVTICPGKNEPVSNLIMNSLKLVSQATEPNSYYLVLHALFRAIGGGRFEILYNEVLPLLQTVLEQLDTLLKSTDKSRKDLFVELILTVPFRLSVLLPYLSYLMRPLVHALQAGSELVSQGVRTLELCVDNLTQEFLNPLFAPVIDEVMVGLWKLLRPLPFNHQHAHTTMRILGKIGGRNRKGFSPPKLERKPVGPDALLNVKLEGKDAALKPVLVNLADHKKLSVASLHVRSGTPSQLLTNYFKVGIGQKLVDHFRSLAVPADILRAAARQSSEDGELEVMAAIINIFHLLPHPAAGQYLENVVEMGFRLVEERFVPTFRAVLASEHGKPIRDYFSGHAQELFAPCFEKDGELGYHAALVIRERIGVEQGWIVRCDQILPLLITRWVSDIRRTRLKIQGVPHVQQLKEDSVVVDIFIAYLQQEEHVDLLFHLVEAYTYPTSADHTVLSRFLNSHVALSEDVGLRRRILDRFIDIYENPAVTQAHKSAALRLLVNPILLVVYSRGERKAGVVDSDWIAKVHAKLWLLPHNIPLDLGALDEEELREVIKFGWISIRFDDIAVTQTAYILIASFLAEYESPAKIVAQIYVALLRAHRPEARSLVREAIDTLAPALPKRMPGGSASGPAQVPGWAFLTRRTLIEEGSTMPLLVNIYQLIVRHPDLFFAARDQFFPHMVASLAKLTLNSAITSDTRVLTLDDIEVILKWEKKRVELAKQDEGKMEVDNETTERSPKRIKTERGALTAPSVASSGAGMTYIPPPSLRDQVVNNLLRFISNSPERVQRNNLVHRALALLRELIGPGVWGESNVKLSFFTRSFASEVGDDSLSQLCNSAEILNVVSSYKPAE
ncbi:hypothetical protein JCM10908_003861 [Rhodotorula pacifica]|uniref:uncharacterized protein n=1 Tax=Rhodotorula pacifica TaxID=1495444 RepID=UPI0031826C91